MNNTQSAFLDSLYKMAGDESSSSHVEVQDMLDEREPLTPNQINDKKIACLNGVAKHMTLNSIPCDDPDDIKEDVFAAVDRYFASNRGSLVQYFADTDNTVTQKLREAMEDNDLIDDDVVEIVVDEVSNDADIDTVINRIKSDITDSAEKDIQDIIDNIKDEPEQDAPGEGGMMAPMGDVQPAASLPAGSMQESVFHHYLMKQYTEAEVPKDIDQLLLTPMIETALHYVRRVLFSDGFNKVERRR